MKDARLSHRDRREETTEAREAQVEMIATTTAAAVVEPAAEIVDAQVIIIIGALIAVAAGAATAVVGEVRTNNVLTNSRLAEKVSPRAMSSRKEIRTRRSSILSSKAFQNRTSNSTSCPTSLKRVAAFAARPNPFMFLTLLL
jgi:hypothetical protein